MVAARVAPEKELTSTVAWSAGQLRGTSLTDDGCGGRELHAVQQEVERNTAAATPESDNGLGMDQRRLGRGVATKALPVTRQVRNRKKLVFLVVGDTKDPRFNGEPDK